MQLCQMIKNDQHIGTSGGSRGGTWGTHPPLSKGLDDTSLPLPLPLPLTQGLDLALGNVTINFI